MIEVKKYFRHPNKQYAGNPFIETFPYLSRDNIARILAATVECHEEERRHDKELRLQYIARLSSMVIPTDNQIDFALNVWNAILQSYVGRCNTEKAEDQFYRLCSSLISNEVPLQPNDAFGSHSYIVCIGTCGTGKSISLAALFSRLGKKLFYHPKLKAFQLLSITVIAPGNGKDSKTLARSVYKALFDVCVENGIPAPKLSAHASAAQFRETARDLAKMLNLGVLIIDEMQHVVRATTGPNEETMKFLTDFANDFKVRIVLIGTWKLAMLANSEDRMVRRLVSPENTFFKRAQSVEEFRPFLDALFNIQYTHRFSILTDEIANAFYSESQGIADCAVKLLMLCQYEAIWSGDEEITESLVKDVAETHLSLLFPMVSRLREGISETDRIFYDTEPTDFMEYLAALEAEQALRSASKATSGSSVASAVKTDAVKKALMASGLASAQTALQVSTKVVAENPAGSVAEHLTAALKPALAKRSPRITAATKVTKKKDDYFGELDGADFRKIAYEAWRSNVAIGDRFGDMSLIAVATDDLLL